MNTPSDDRSSLATAFQWSSRIIIVSLEMVLPGLAGYWLDRQLGTVLLFLVVGLVVGGIGGVWHLVRLTSTNAKVGSHRADKSNDTETKTGE